MTWKSTGSSVSGVDYGYEIYHDGHHAHYAVMLFLGSSFAPIAATLIPCDTYEDAAQHGQRFTHVMHCWRIVKERTRLLNAGICLTGGPHARA